MSKPYKLKIKPWHEIDDQTIEDICKLRSVGTARAKILQTFPDVPISTLNNIIYSDRYKELRA